MCDPRVLEVEEGRWNSLNQTLKRLDADYHPDTSLDFPRKKTLHSLIECLRVFAESQFYFFHDGFGSHVSGHSPKKHGPLRLEMPPPKGEYSLQYVFGVTLDQIAYDLEAIRRAAWQRISGSAEMKAALVLADNYAQEVLRPAIVQGMVKNTTVITYLQKFPSVRVIPYAPVAIIGIPYTVAPVSTPPSKENIVARDYLATPHEIGHYVYWHSQVDNGFGRREPLGKVLNGAVGQYSDEEKVVKRWVEEIFADIYGALTGGPVMALASQDLQLKRPGEVFAKEDGKHPAPILRPNIYVKVLNSKQTKHPLTQNLFNHWRNRLDDRGIIYPYHENFRNRPEIKTPDHSPFQPEDIISSDLDIDNSKPVDIVISKVLEQLGFIPLKLPYNQVSIDELYEDFEDKLLNNLDSTRFNGPELELAVDTDGDSIIQMSGEQPQKIKNIWGDWIKEQNFFEELTVADWIQDETRQVPAGTVENLRQNPYNPDGSWIYVLNAAGWTTEGPQGSH